VNFILGVGAQKCGTSWLAGYLASHPQVFMTPYKELHVFDAMFAPEVSGYNPENRFDELHIILDRLLKGENRSRSELSSAIEKYSLSLSDNAYLSYFKNNVRNEHRAMGEITPSYSLIPQDGFRYIRNLLMKGDLNPRVIFIMRDPVERVYSQLRFNQGRGVAAVQDSYASALADPQIIMRTRYDQTIANLRNEFKPEELLFLFYEELFCDESIQIICQFLGIEIRPADFSKRVNVSPDVGHIDSEFEQAARKVLDPVYVFCADQFGREKIGSLWKTF
jgi:hypothetical protein